MATEGKFGRCASLRAPMATGIRADSVVAAAEPNVELVVEPAVLISGIAGAEATASSFAKPVAKPVADPVVEPVVKRMPVWLLWLV